MSQPYLEPYRQSHARHGANFEVTCWASPRSQELRFEVFTQMCFLAGKRVLDAGCSRGDLAVYLHQRQIWPARYIGIDALPEVIAFARQRHLPDCEFHAGDLLRDATLWRLGAPQVIAISGTLNTMTDAAAFTLLSHAWEAGPQTLLFNFLSSRTHRQVAHETGPVRRMDPLQLLDWALARTSSVALRQDYFAGGHDATICMSRA